MSRISAVLAALLLSAPLFAHAIEVDRAWARATVPGQTGSGAYMTVTSATPVRIVGVSTPAAGVAQLHRMSMQGTTMKMQAVDALDVPAGKPVELKPGGFHVMLMDLKQPLKSGDKLPLTLRIEGPDRKITEQTIPVEVRDGPPASPPH
jgi:copper(I)-binding protein